MRERRVVVVERMETCAATRSLTFVLVFCFAGCAAGSCLSYGHSCWGAHGKRSGHYASAEVRPVITAPRGNDEEPLQQDQWILSRLVTRPLSSPSANKFRGNWYDATKIHSRRRGWNANDDVAILSDNINAIRRDDEAGDDDDEGGIIRGATVQVLPRLVPEEVLEPREISESDELVLAPSSSGEHMKSGDKSHKLRLIEILNGATDKLK